MRIAVAAGLFGLSVTSVACAAAPPGEPSPMPAVSTATQASEPTELPPAPASPTLPAGESSMPLQLTSPAFAAGETIPQRFSCDGENVSPALQWTEPPEGTRSLALILDDPDAPGGTWVHWVLFNIPASARGLPERVSDAEEQPDGARHGRNSWGQPGYGGPCPPSGTHRYFFRLYALDQPLDLPALADRAQLQAALQAHTLAQAELMGTYSR